MHHITHTMELERGVHHFPCEGCDLQKHKYMQSLTHAYDILESKGIGDTNGEVVSKSDYRKLKMRGIIFCISYISQLTSLHLKC